MSALTIDFLVSVIVSTTKYLVKRIIHILVQAIIYCSCKKQAKMQVANNLL